MDLPEEDEATFTELARRAERGELPVRRTFLSGAAAAAYGRQLIEEASADPEDTPTNPGGAAS